MVSALEACCAPIATPQCYDYEVGSPGWSFFHENEALPDHRLGNAQLSNRLLIPPDTLPFQGSPNVERMDRRNTITSACAVMLAAWPPRA